MDATTRRRRLYAGLALPALLIALSTTSPTAAATTSATTATVRFDIPAGPLDGALAAYASQTHRQLFYDQGLVVGRRAPEVRGTLTADEALSRILVGSSIVTDTRRADVVVLRPAGGAGADAADRGDSFPATAITPLIAADSAPAKPGATMLDTLVITGSHIRGGGPEASPIIALTRDALDRSGRATVADALNALPQNFGGAGTPVTLLTGADTSFTNSQAANGVNLRGLGADATLVLINGRRLAGTGLRGDFADISVIPTAAVERVEVLLDGASALYGSDAVGGVVNVILRHDFDGAETRARIGAASGGAEEAQVAHTQGWTWDGGHLLASYEHYQRDALAASKRGYTASEDLRPLGGTDHRSFYASPGNLIAFDPVQGAYVPTYAIPVLPSGATLKPSDFRPGAVNLGSTRGGADLLPNQKRDSLYLAGEEALGGRVKLNGDVLFSRRTFAFNSAPSSSPLEITSANPNFVSPDGSTDELIAYNFGRDIGPIRSSGSSEALALSLGASAEVGRTWRVTGYGAFAQEIGVETDANQINSSFLDEALGNVPDDPKTAYQAARDGYFNPYGSGAANSRTVLDFVASGYAKNRNVSRNSTANLQADGTLFTLPGGPVRAAIGLDGRREQFSEQVTSLLDGATPRIGAKTSYSRTVTAAFVELRAPLVGADNALPGVQRLELTLAGRIEDFSDVGSTTNPKVGLVWEPADGVRLRTTYGTSFRAPSLIQVNQAPIIGAGFFPNGAVKTLSVIRQGGNPDLRPETATSWTAGADLTPASVPGLKLSATWFRTVFSDRISQPVRDDLFNALTNPALAGFVQRVSPATNPADAAAVAALLADPSFPFKGLFPVSAFGAMVDARWVNTARVQVEGLDGQASYTFDRGEDHFDLSANASYLLSFDRQITPRASTIGLVGDAGQPSRLRARGEAAWRRGAYGATLGLNYLGAERDATGRRIDAWTTADLQVSWTPNGQGALKGLSLALNVQNLTDADPPFYDAPQGVGFDPANADPLGRFVSLQLTKRW